MAITYITGVAGSGKSYFSCYTIWKMFNSEVPQKQKYSFLNHFQWLNYYIFPKKSKYKYTFVYTNINEFNYDYHPLLVPLEFELLYKNLTKLHRLAVLESMPDTELIEHAKELNLFNVLIVVDEAQDYMTSSGATADKVLLWWLTYHRHLHQDIHFLTQHVDQINKNYLRNGIYFYKMPPPSLALSKKNFTISNYSCIAFTEKCREKSFMIPFKKEVGNLYISGNEQQRKSVLTKYLFIFPLLILFIYLAYWFFDNTRQEVTRENNGIPSEKNEVIKDEIQNIKKTNINDTSINNEDIEIEKLDTTDLILVNVNCINELCKYKDKSFPLDFLLFIFQKVDIKYSHHDKINYQYNSYTFLVNKSILDIFNFPNSKKNLLNSPQNQIKLFGN